MTNLQFLIKHIPDIELASIGGATTTQTAKNWKNGTQPSTESYVKFSEHFGKSILWLMSKREESIGEMQ